MIDVHLIGYTADLEHLVFDLDGESSGRYRLVVDADLIATLAQIRERCDQEGKPWPGDEVVVRDEEWDEDTEDWDDEDVEGASGLEADGDATDAAEGASQDDQDGAAAHDQHALTPPPEPPEAEPDEARQPDGPGSGARTGGRTSRSVPDGGASGDAVPASAALRDEPDRPDPQLSPAQIQALLRAGRSPQSVASKAGTDVAWIERWLPPILEERARVLREARALRLSRPRLGTSRASLGDAVGRALADRNVDEGDVAWEASRRSDGRWKVSVKYRHRNRSRTASWTYDPREGEIEAASDLAKELGFRAPRPKSKAQTKARSKAQTKSKPKSTSKSQTRAKAKTRSATESKAAPKADAGPEAAPTAEPGPDAGAEPRSSAPARRTASR